MKGQRIVVIASGAQVRSEVKQVIGALGYQITGEAENPEEGLRLIRRVQPDLILLEPAGRGMSLLDILGQEGETPTVAILGPQEQHLMERAVDAGAAGVVFTPLGVMELAPVLMVALHNFKQIAKLQQKLRSLEEDLEVRKLVDRAKGKVMSITGMEESEAYRWMQKISMDTQRSLKRVATDVIKDRMEFPVSEAGKES